MESRRGGRQKTGALDQRRALKSGRGGKNKDAGGDKTESGGEIQKQLANSNKLMGRVLYSLSKDFDLEEVIKKVEELHPPVEEEKEEEGIDIEAKEEITFDDFMKMQFQVGEIIACEEVKKSKKLLCSQVKIGSQVKQIVSGILCRIQGSGCKMEW